MAELTEAELQNKLQNLVALTGTAISRIQHFSRLGYSHDGDRDIYEALGYKLDLVQEDFYAQYQRQDIANAIINKPISATWRGPVKIIESDDNEETVLEKAWGELEKELQLKSKFSRLDKLVALGHYAVLFLGFNDAQNSAMFSMPVAPGNRELLYVKPIAEINATIQTLETDTVNPRYGLPLLYKITITQLGNNSSADVLVHHSRILHVAGEDLLENDLEGAPKLEVVFNRLKDLEKLVGGSAEMFWKGARPGYQGKVDPEYQMTTETKADLKAQISEYEHNLRRIMVNEGVDLQALSMQIADPQNHVDVQIQMISAVTGIPKRILTGSERGELASTEDRANWFDLVQSRREEYAEPRIVRLFVDRCIEYKVLPESKDTYMVEWTSLYEQSEKDKAEVGKLRSEALKNYGSVSMNQDVLPVEAFYKMLLNLTDEQIELIMEQRKQAIVDEDNDFDGSEDIEEEEI